MHYKVLRMAHPNKDIQAALAYAGTKGWRFEKSSARAHAYGRLYCHHAERDGCKMSIWSTPRNPTNFAKAIRRAVDACPHPQPEKS